MPKVPTITDLDRVQRGVVEYQPYDAPMFVNGPPGSGKTHIAILRLQVLLNNGYTNVMFLLYNHSMYGFLNSIFKSLGMTANVNIDTKDQYFTTLAKSSGHYEVYGANDYETAYNARLQHLLNRTPNERYDVIVIDECQDFSEMEITILRKLTDKIIAVGDLDQKVYEMVPSSYFRQLDSRKLQTIYRFGKKVARIAQPFSRSGEQLESKVSTLNDTDVYRVRAAGSTDVTNSIFRIISAKKFTNQTIAILSPTNLQLNNINNSLANKGIVCFKASSNKDFREYEFDSGKPILITPFSAKGMEFDVVILYGYNTDLDKTYMLPKKKELLYVSLTRTSDELYFIEESDSVSDLKELSGWVDLEGMQSGRGLYDNGF